MTSCLCAARNLFGKTGLRACDYLAVGIASTTLAYIQPAHAVEGASGFYLFGGKGSMAGILAPEGRYYQNDFYYYSGEATTTTSLPDSAGTLAFGLEADSFLNLSTYLVSTDKQVLGGRFAYGLVLPVIYKDISTSATASFGGVPLGGSASDDTLAFGDPLLTGTVGWSSGNWHSPLNFLLNIPIGSYNQNRLANANFNRWGLDTTLAVTWLDPSSGYEVTVTPGFTWNGVNDVSGYNSGNEFHVEFAAMKHQSEQLSYELSGYHYEQVTGDSGSASSSFKGSLTAIGPALNYNFLAGQTPISPKARYMHEFGAENRLEGDAFLIQLAIPL